jgi:hypothetical protein
VIPLRLMLWLFAIDFSARAILVARLVRRLG